MKTRNIGFYLNSTTLESSDGDGLIELEFDFGFSVNSETLIAFVAIIDHKVSETSSATSIIDNVKDLFACGTVFSSLYN